MQKSGIIVSADGKRHGQGLRRGDNRKKKRERERLKRACSSSSESMTQLVPGTDTGIAL